LFILGFFYKKNSIEHHLQNVTAPYVEQTVWISLNWYFEAFTGGPMFLCVTSGYSSKVKSQTAWIWPFVHK
jgi:hypothetical protein